MHSTAPYSRTLRPLGPRPGDPSPKQDIFSLGVLLWEMLTSLRPWAGLNPLAIALTVSAETLTLCIVDVTVCRDVAGGALFISIIHVLRFAPRAYGPYGPNGVAERSAWGCPVVPADSTLGLMRSGMSPL